MSKFNFIYSEPTGSGEVIGRTPHGIYDTDTEFQNDSLTTCKYVASKLGHPVMQLEFNSGSIYACFEEAVSEYSQQINHYNTRNWMWEHYGNSTTGSNFSSSPTVKIVGNDNAEITPASTTRNSSTQITITTPTSGMTASNEPYGIKVLNSSGLSKTVGGLLSAGFFAYMKK